MLREINKRRPLCYALDSDIIKLKDCPDCSGRGWFCENPFQEYNKVYWQCPTCLDAFIHHGKTGELPQDIEKAMTLFNPQPPRGGDCEQRTIPTKE